MKNNKPNYPPYTKAFYRISKERLDAYLSKLKEATGIIYKLRPDYDKGDVNWRKVDEAGGKIIDVFNSLIGFKHYENAQAGGEVIQDTFLYDYFVELDNGQFFDIEFPNGVKEVENDDSK